MRGKILGSTYEINGKTYQSLDEVPPEYRELLADRDGDGIPDSFEKSGVMIQKKVVVLGKGKDGLSALSPEQRRILGSDPESARLARSIMGSDAPLETPALSAGWIGKAAILLVTIGVLLFLVFPKFLPLFRK